MDRFVPRAFGMIPCLESFGNEGKYRGRSFLDNCPSLTHILFFVVVFNGLIHRS